MKSNLKVFVFSTLIFLLAATGCSGQEPAPTTSAEATALASGLTLLPPGTNIVITSSPGSDTAQTPGAGTSGTAVSVLPQTQQSQGDGVPVTGARAASVLCQFCVDEIAHAVILLPMHADFELVAPASGSPTAGTSCNAIEEINGKKVVVCYGAPGTDFEMNVCTNGECSSFPVQFERCTARPDQPPVEPQDTAPPEATGTAISTLPAPSEPVTPTAVP